MSRKKQATHVRQKALQLEVVDAGHIYRLPSFDGEVFQTLAFMKREGEGYPGNVGHYPGTNLQSVLRACLDRVIYLQGQIPHENNIAIMCHLKHCLRELEQRAAERHGFNVHLVTLDLASFGAMCVVCGHVVCGHSVSDCGGEHAGGASSETSPPASNEAVKYVQCRCPVCGWQDGIRSDSIHEKGVHWCDKCNEQRDFIPATGASSPNSSLVAQQKQDSSEPITRTGLIITHTTSPTERW